MSELQIKKNKGKNLLLTEVGKEDDDESVR